MAEVARRLGITPDTVRVWRRRFLERRFDGLCDGPRPGPSAGQEGDHRGQQRERHLTGARHA
ncbi:helix-turn-helix domain-containing protein, partial [Streptomyces mirabilis]|uniref:helix-turn-helix domain-containing protein n=1 Tax=Streptomyces mirabilis TaxID=68239 RepID=UPI003F4D4171